LLARFVSSLLQLSRQLGCLLLELIPRLLGALLQLKAQVSALAAPRDDRPDDRGSCCQSPGGESVRDRAVHSCPRIWDVRGHVRSPPRHRVRTPAARRATRARTTIVLENGLSEPLVLQDLMDLEVTHVPTRV
jgi:hypothetical protein